MRALGVLLVLILLCAMPPARAQETLDDLTLRQRILQAEGKPPDAYREETDTTATNGNYVELELHRGTDFKSVIELGPFHEEYGRFQGRAWDRNANGLTTVHDPALGRERPDPIKVTISRIAQPFDAWRVARLNSRGFGTVQSVDPKTYRVLREEVLTRAGTIRTDFDDFRTINGYTTPFHSVTDDQAHHIYGESRVVKFDVADVSDADLAIPTSASFLTFPSAQNSVELPARFEFGEVIVRVMVGDRGLDFVLDSGASGIAIDDHVVRELGLQRFAEYSRTTAGRYDAALAIVPEMRVGDLRMRNVAVGTIPFGFEFGPYTEQRTKLVGLLGYDFIRSVGLIIDYANHRVTAMPPDKFVPPLMTPESDILPIRIGGHVPEVSATINGALAEHMVIDTGANGQLMLFDYFVRRYPEALSLRVATRLANLPYVPQGIGGGFQAVAYRLQQVDVGRYHFRNYDALTIVSQRRFQFAQDGLIGYGLLQHFTLCFDYAGGKLYLVHNPGQ